MAIIIMRILIMRLWITIFRQRDPGDYLDNCFLYVYFVHVGKYKVSSDFISNKAVNVAGRFHTKIFHTGKSLTSHRRCFEHNSKYGYGSPFTSIPHKCFIRNSKSALKHPNFVKDTILKSYINRWLYSRSIFSIWVC